MSKTILVVYSNAASISSASVGTLKRYSFNTEAELKVGDVIKTREYTTNLHVVKILDKAYKYYNSATGELSDTFTSSSQWDIKNLFIVDEDITDVHGVIVK